MKHNRYWYEGRRLPHFDAPNIQQFITICLIDSFPAKLKITEKFDEILDKNYCKYSLSSEVIGEILQNKIISLNQKQYKLYDWVIMPSHVHFLIEQIPNTLLEDSMRNLKSILGYKYNKFYKRKGKVWISGYFDTFIRNEEHFDQVKGYIMNNPVKAKLCLKANEWKFSSFAFK